MCGTARQSVSWRTGLLATIDSLQFLVLTEARQFHKSLCKKFVQAMKERRPNSNMRLALLIKEGESEPGFCWTPVASGEKSASQYDGDDDDSDILGALAENLGVPIKDNSPVTILPTKASSTGKVIKQKATEMLVCGEQGSGELLSYSIHVAASRPSVDDAAPNKYLARFFGENITSRYRGNTSLYAMTKVYDSSITVDIDTRGFALALDALATRASLGQTPRIEAKGVRVNAAKPYYEQIEVPIRHPIFSKGSIARVACMLGDNLLTYKPAAQGGVAALAPSSHPPAPVNPGAWLLLESDILPSNFGSIPAAAKADTRSMLVANSAFAEDGGRGHLSTLMLKSLIGVLKHDVYSYLSDTSHELVEQSTTVVKYNMWMRKEFTDTVKRAFEERAREKGYESGDSEFEAGDGRTPKAAGGNVPGSGNDTAKTVAGKVNAAKTHGAGADASKSDATEPGRSKATAAKATAAKTSNSKKANAKGDEGREEDGSSTRLAYYFHKAVLLW